MEVGPPQIQVHDHRAQALGGQKDPEVGGEGALADASLGPAHGDDPSLPHFHRFRLKILGGDIIF